jgi:hypothetical protein
MCYFLTLGVPAKCADVMNSTAPRGFALNLVQNQSVLAQLPPDFRTYHLTSGMCSCDLYRRHSKRAEDPSEFLRRKYRKKGWSDSRIERAVEQSSKHAKHKKPFVGLRPDAATIVGELARKTGRVAVIAHFYHGDTEQEAIRLGPVRSVTNEELLAARIPFDEDELIWVTDSLARG